MRYEIDLPELDMKLLKQFAEEDGRSVRKQGEFMLSSLIRDRARISFVLKMRGQKKERKKTDSR